MMSFECGLRRKQRELGIAIQQRDRIIREQAIVIRFLAEKTGNKTRKISDLRNEAMAKIPQIVIEDSDAALTTDNPGASTADKSDKKAGKMSAASGSPPLHLTTIRVSGGGTSTGAGAAAAAAAFPPSSSMGTELTSILETGSENGDSDSAIILDDSLGSSTLSSSSSSHHGASSDHLSSSASSSEARRRCHLRRISRSVSDVMSVSLVSEEGMLTGNDVYLGNLNDDRDLDEALEDGDNSCGDKSTGSVSDPEDQPGSFDRESVHYRGFLLRHGSYERYKVRSLRLKKTTTFKELTQQQSRQNQTVAQTKASSGATNQKTGIHLHHNNISNALSGSLGSLSTHSSSGLSSPNSTSSSSSSSSSSNRPQPSINHRNVTKPRDVKNRHLSKVAKTAANAISSSSSNSGPVAAATVAAANAMNCEEEVVEACDSHEDDHLENDESKMMDFVIAEKHGSVYHSSVFLDNEDAEQQHSFA